MGKKNYNSIKYITLDEHTKNHMNDDKLSTARAEKSFKAEIGAKPNFTKENMERSMIHTPVEIAVLH